jgi:hypothetical protein
LAIADVVRERVRRAGSTIAIVVALVGTLGCAAHVPVVRLVPAASEREPVVAELPSPAACSSDPNRCYVPEDAVVRLVGPQMTCTGTLVDEDLVLTAVHCVVKRGPSGEFTRDLLDPKELTVELGGDYLPWGHVGVTSIVSLTSDDGRLCGEQGGEGDLAVLVLPRKLVGVGTMTPSEKPPVVHAVLEPIGFGRCAMSEDAIRRQQREGGQVDWFNATIFQMRASICPGDSGGPVHVRGSREIVGVVSLSAMDGDDRTSAQSRMVRVDTYRGLFDRARHIADGTPTSELPPVACSR